MILFISQQKNAKIRRTLSEPPAFLYKNPKRFSLRFGFLYNENQRKNKGESKENPRQLL